MPVGKTNSIFIHGLESSSYGTKATFFRNSFPEMIVPDFSGSLDQRMRQLQNATNGLDSMLMIGSSFGGMMVAVFAIENPARVKKVVLLAPALNFPDFKPYLQQETDVPANLYIGHKDIVCPIEQVEKAAHGVFSNLEFNPVDDDHLLRDCFASIDWNKIIK